LLIIRDWVVSGPGQAAFTTMLGLALFGSVALHELGHALMARRFGIDTHHITLYPFGGIAMLSQPPSNPRQELWIALAGPAVNFLLVGLAGLVALLVPIVSTPALIFLILNLVLGVFNLLPAFPMDGGRVLRAWFVVRRGYIAGTTKALNVGLVFAWGFIVLGLYDSANLLLIGGFLLLAIRSERRRLRAAVVRHTALQRQADEYGKHSHSPMRADLD